MKILLSILLLFTAGVLLGLVPVINYEETKRLTTPWIAPVGTGSALIIMAGVLCSIYFCLRGRAWWDAAKNSPNLRRTLRVPLYRLNSYGS
jgi:Ni,Fe-hydrogenase I cytochrome b subunit